jgi:EpsI family protein
MEEMSARGYIVVIPLLAVLVAYTYALRYRDVERPPAPALDSIPARLGDFTGTDETEEAETLELLGADATLFRTYRGDSGLLVWLFVGYFGRQHENSQIHSPKHCYPGAGWVILDEGSTGISLAGDTVRIKYLTISDGVKTHDILYWFSSADGILTNEFALKWHQMKSSLLGRPQATAFVRFSIDEADEQAGTARSDLVRFAEALAPFIDEALRGSGAAPPRAAAAPPGASSPERTE